MSEPTQHTSAVSVPPQSDAPAHRSSGVWPFALGLLLIVLAAVCFYKVFFGTVQNQMLVGVFMLVGGFAEGVHAIFGRAWREFVADLAPALLYVLSGMIIVADPQTGSFMLTLVLAAALVTGAVYRVVASWRSRPLSGWQTLGAAVIVSILAWLILLWTWPTSALWVLGSVAGVGLVTTGVAWIQRGIAARRAHEEL
jgi:uncharacterized membrane protein HdeD (DUF308 family)